MVASCVPTVDGQNPAPVDMVNSPLFIGFHTSQVVQDFVHQQYVCLGTRGYKLSQPRVANLTKLLGNDECD